MSRTPGRHFFFVFPPFVPSSLWAAELLRGFFFPSFFAVALPLPLFSATPTPYPGRTAERPGPPKRAGAS
jgi:hypothetical protein